MGDSSEETQNRSRSEGKLAARQVRTRGNAPQDEGAWRLQEAAGDPDSPPARERTDVAPCDVAIEVHTSGAIDRA